jgi:hypothetical protein
MRAVFVRDTAGVLDPILRCVMLMAAVAPLAVTTAVSQPEWDDASYLQLAACVNRSFYGLSLHGIGTCLHWIRPPITAPLLLLAGPLHEVAQLGEAPFLLACLTFGLALLVAWITFRASVPLLAVAAAALAIRLCGPIVAADAPFEVDGIFALVVAVALLLPLLEYAAPAALPREAVVRGLLWGGIAGLGALTKVTFGFFGVAVAPLILLASFWGGGAAASSSQRAVSTAMCLLPAAIYVHYGSEYLDNAWRSSYGNLAQYYNDGRSPWEFIRYTAASPGYGFWIICACLLFVASIRSRHDLARLALGLASVAIAVVYLLLATGSLNRDARFVWSIWLILPLAIAGAIAPARNRPRAVAQFSAAPILVLVFLCSVPMFSRLDFRNVREADAVLRFLPADRPTKVEIASDTPHLNFVTLWLAQQVDWEALSKLEIRSVVWDAGYGRNLEYSEQQLRAADFVLISWPISALTASKPTNRYLANFLATTRACGRLIVTHPGPSDLLVFDMHTAHDAACQTAGAAAHAD